MFPASPFWDFSLRLYARDGVPPACLRLQDRHGIDVNILFCCLWLGMEGHGATRRDVARMISRVRVLHDEVVRPLRLARTALKRMLTTESADLLPAAGALRAAVKKSELDSEHLEQIMLTALRPQRPPRLAGPDLARANATTYFAVHGARLGRTDHADLSSILATLGSGIAVKLEPPRAASLRRGRKQVLASAGRGA